ncbi:ABC transporter permease [Mobilicoccus caccae]|uniref:Peptide ABC transporter permease n=1 Tax=Mobilicoccus caccae TaxID=1859295 RepID=A0ABQ6IRD7_9MICO|nr:ABC transporter permease [Mobilicoccus caccae]GMA39269.1 peptide ABC transporter permease [Mobilicoccus caccae]
MKRPASAARPAGRPASRPPVRLTPRRRRRLDPALLVGATIVGLLVLLAAVSLVWTPHDPLAMDAATRLAPPDGEHWLGTDKFGRDVASSIMVGARTTLLVGIVSVGIAALVGVPLGILAAMGPRWLGLLLMRGTDILLAFPALLLAIMFSAVYGASTTIAMLAIGIATIPTFARVTRSGALTVLRAEFVPAARLAGLGGPAIAVRHVLPNIVGLVIVQASVAFAIAILAEAALSFLGLGTPPPTPSWGRMLQESQEMLWSAPRLALIPGTAIALAVLGFNLLGDGLRDLLDPRLKDRT